MSAHDLARAQGVDDALHSFPMCTDKEGADNDAYVAGYQETRQLLQTLLSDQKRELLLAGLLLNTPDTTVQELARSRQALMHVQAVTAMAMRRMEQGQEPDARLWAALIYRRGQTWRRQPRRRGAALFTGTLSGSGGQGGVKQSDSVSERDRGT